MILRIPEFRLPFVWRVRFDRLVTENFTLRDALREANAELARHRRLLAGLREGRVEVMRAVEKVIRA